MALSLNTSHALYANLLALICVDGGTIKDLVTPGRTFNTSSGGTVGTGTWGEHLKTNTNAFSLSGATMSPGVTFETHTTPISIFIAGNAFENGNAVDVAPLFGSSTNFPPVIAVNNAGMAGIAPAYNPGTYSSTDVSGNGAHTLCLLRPAGDPPGANASLYADKVSVVSGVDPGWGAESVIIDEIGGWGGQGTAGAEIVYFAVFDKVLSPAEITELHDSLTGSNAFALVDTGSSGTTRNVAGTNSTQASTSTSGAITIGPTIGTITTDPFKNNTGTLQKGLTGLIAAVLDLATMNEVVVLTGQTTDAVTAVMTVEDELIVPGTWYALAVKDADDVLGIEKYQAG